MMPTTRIAVTLRRDLLEELDAWVRAQRLPSRSHAVQAAIQEKLARTNRKRLARECAKLDVRSEQALADGY